jgi:hypothetical protein
MKNVTVTTRAAYIFGGKLTEKACMADYGEYAGGYQKVNCRLAATPLPPEETMRYLVNEKPVNHWKISVDLSYVF